MYKYPGFLYMRLLPGGCSGIGYLKHPTVNLKGEGALQDVLVCCNYKDKDPFA